MDNFYQNIVQLSKQNAVLIIYKMTNQVSLSILTFTLGCRYTTSEMWLDGALFYLFNFISFLDKLLEEQEVTRGKDEYVAQLRSKPLKCLLSPF